MTVTALEILYQDEACVAVNKPPGMLVHPTKLDPHSHSSVQQLLHRQMGMRVFPIHRLDRPTSGVLLFGFSAESTRYLSQQFEQRQVVKKYIAIVRGHTDPSGQIARPLKERLDRISDPGADRDKPAQEAITDYETVARSELPFSAGRYSTSRFSLVELRPLTGRGHQIRRHLNGIAHPIIGDTRHGDHRHNQFFKNEFNLSRLLLASTSLNIKLMNGEQVEITARPDCEFDRACELLKLAPCDESAG
jgi:tRNA pseudouridine65 synthase